MIPASAAIRRGQLTFVYAVNAESRAILLPVSPGAEIHDRLEVLAGIRDGDRVIADPPPSLSDGTLVAGGRP